MKISPSDDKDISKEGAKVDAVKCLFPFRIVKPYDGLGLQITQYGLSAAAYTGVWC